MISPPVTDAARLLFSIFVADLLPIFVIAGVGFLLGRYATVDVRTVSRITFHAFAPALVFNLLVTSTLGGLAFGRMALFYLRVATSAGARSKARVNAANDRSVSPRLLYR